MVVSAWPFSYTYEQLADGARIATFLPLLAERFTNERLTALAQSDGKVG